MFSRYCLKKNTPLQSSPVSASPILWNIRSGPQRSDFIRNPATRNREAGRASPGLGGDPWSHPWFSFSYIRKFQTCLAPSSPFSLPHPPGPTLGLKFQERNVCMTTFAFYSICLVCRINGNSRMHRCWNSNYGLSSNLFFTFDTYLLSTYWAQGLGIPW